MPLSATDNKSIYAQEYRVSLQRFGDEFFDDINKLFADVKTCEREFSRHIDAGKEDEQRINLALLHIVEKHKNVMITCTSVWESFRRLRYALDHQIKQYISVDSGGLGPAAQERNILRSMLEQLPTLENDCQQLQTVMRQFQAQPNLERELAEIEQLLKALRIRVATVEQQASEHMELLIGAWNKLEDQDKSLAQQLEKIQYAVKAQLLTPEERKRQENIIARIVPVRAQVRAELQALVKKITATPEPLSLAVARAHDDAETLHLKITRILLPYIEQIIFLMHQEKEILHRIHSSLTVRYQLPDHRSQTPGMNEVARILQETVPPLTQLTAKALSQNTETELQTTGLHEKARALQMEFQTIASFLARMHQDARIIMNKRAA